VTAQFSGKTHQNSNTGIVEHREVVDVDDKRSIGVLLCGLIQHVTEIWQGRQGNLAAQTQYRHAFVKDGFDALIA